MTWLPHTPGDPPPKGNVRIRQKDPNGNLWENPKGQYIPAEEWRGWKSGTITHYQKEPK